VSENQRENVSIPSGSTRARNCAHASRVYSVASVCANAPAPVAAQVSTRDAWSVRHRGASCARTLRPSPTTIFTRGSASSGVLARSRESISTKRGLTSTPSTSEWPKTSADCRSRPPPTPTTHARPSGRSQWAALVTS
jgi:hypothetical protein